MKRLFCLVLVAAVAALVSELPCSAVPDRKLPIEQDALKPFINSSGMKFVWMPRKIGRVHV